MRTFRNTGTFILIASILFLSVSCSKDDKEEDAWISADPSSIILEANGAAQLVTISSNQYTQAYEIIDGETTAKWVKVLRQNEFMSVSADPNYSTKPRQEAKIQLRAGVTGNVAASYITINQKANYVNANDLNGLWKIGDNILTMQDGSAALLTPDPILIDEYIKDPDYIFNYSYNSNTNLILFERGGSTAHTLPLEYLSDSRMDIGNGNVFSGSYSKINSNNISVSSPLDNNYFSNNNTPWKVEGEDDDYLYIFYTDGTGNILKPVDIYNNIFTVLDGFAYSYNWKTNHFVILVNGEITPLEYSVQDYSENNFVLSSKTESGKSLTFNAYTGDIQIEEP